ncbi:MAG TPA: hypothetical protein VFJ74_04945 [Gemmatimonadaceae bacterium]|nr:hypothetical protein [Gemmatimonadaceae bacterium]
MTPPADGRDGERAAARSRLAGALGDHLPYKAAALFFSIALWLVVASAETAERLVTVRVVPRLEEGVALAGEPPAVRAVVVGRARDLVTLGDVPLVVRRVAAQEVTGDSVRVELRPSDVDLPARSSAVVRDLQPRVVTLHLVRVGGAAAAESTFGAADAGRR